MSSWSSAPPIDHATALELVAASATVDDKIAADNDVDNANYGRPGLQTMVVLGDSLTEQGGALPTGTDAAHRDVRPYAAWAWGNVLLGQRFRILANHGVGGENSAQILARTDAALALNPGWIALLSGTNDVGAVGGVSAAKAGITAILDKCAAAGVRVLLGTLPPRVAASYIGTIKADTFDLNAWIIEQTRTRKGVVLADYFSALATGDTGTYRALIFGFNPTSDGAHLSPSGAFACGQVFANALRAITTPNVPFSPPSPGKNLLSQPRFAGAGAVTPAGWSIAGTPVFSAVPRADGLGTWQQAVLGAAGTFNLQSNITVNGTTLAVGDELVAFVEFECEALDQAAGPGLQRFQVSMKAWNGASWFETRSALVTTDSPNASRSGVFRVPEWTVPAGATLVGFYIETYGAGTFRFDRAGVYKTAQFAV